MNTPPSVTLSESRAVAALGSHLGALTTITLWHDFLCPWCYVALFQAERLKAEYGVSLDWRGAELFPPALQALYPPTPPKSVDPAAPKPPPSRFDRFAEAEGVTMPTVQKPPRVSMHPALLAAEYVTVRHGADTAHSFIADVYRAYWEMGADVSDHGILAKIADLVDVPSEPMLASVAADGFAANILEFDDDAYATGVRHVPTFIFGGEERLAEAPYTDLARATERFLIRIEKYRGGS